MSEQINCLRCRRCHLEVDTNLKDVNTMIFCDKLGCRRIINLHGCAMANPQMRYEGAHKLPGHNLTHPDGDKTRYLSAVEIAFVVAHYATILRLKTLQQLTGRDIATLRGIARRYGLHRTAEAERAGRQNAMRELREAQRKKGALPWMFTPAQKEWLLARYASQQPESWPTRGGNRYPSRKAKNDAIRAEILAEIAARGPARTWQAAISFITTQSPAYRRWHQEYRRKKREAAKAIIT